jgi:hypothetical protein
MARLNVYESAYVSIYISVCRSLADIVSHIHGGCRPRRRWAVACPQQWVAELGGPAGAMAPSMPWYARQKIMAKWNFDRFFSEN